MIDFFNKTSASITYALNNSKTMNANNTTANVQLFRVTGTVRFTKIYGIVTTTISSNHTGGFLRINDQTAQVNVTLNTGAPALSSANAGSTSLKTALAGSTATVNSNAAGRVIEPSAGGLALFSEFIVVQKNGANTDIEYTYTTTNTPASGVIQFFVEYQTLSADGAVVAL